LQERTPEAGKKKRRGTTTAQLFEPLPNNKQASERGEGEEAWKCPFCVSSSSFPCFFFVVYLSILLQSKKRRDVFASSESLF